MTTWVTYPEYIAVQTEIKTRLINEGWEDMDTINKMMEKEIEDRQIKISNDWMGGYG